MSAPARLRVVLFVAGGPRRAALVAGLLAKGHPVTCPAEGGLVSPPDGADVLVLHEGELARVPLADGPAGKVRAASIAGLAPDSVAALVDRARADARAPKPGVWKPWFPVIDYGRCTNCMQCLSFCLFDVYGVDGSKKIEVSHPDKCKTNCPACSRVCPEVAILFPKYGRGPINGDTVNPQDVEREKMKIDVSALLGGDIYKLLRERHQKAASRFSKERDEARALAERKRCLAILGQGLDIPAEVMMALPSADEILKKAEVAARRAADALRARAGEPEGGE